MAKSIPLGRKRFALVDDADYQFLSQWKWYWVAGYAARTTYPAGMKGVAAHILMHRQLVGCPDKLQVDHINGDRLDNRKGNLRIATASNNQWNRGIPINNTSGQKGVNWDKVNKKWRACVNSKDKYYHIGRFDTIEEAAAARIEFVNKLHGEFARHK